MYSSLNIHSSLYFVKSMKKYAFKILFVELAVGAKFCSMWWPVLCVYLAVHMIARGESHLFCVTMPRNSVNAFFGIQFIPVKFHPKTFCTQMSVWYDNSCLDLTVHIFFCLVEIWCQNAASTKYGLGEEFSGGWNDLPPFFAPPPSRNERG